LQEFVPETIRSLLAADIRVWMLTGDKTETAVNIAQSSSLCTKRTKMLILDKTSYDEVLETLNAFAEKVQKLQTFRGELLRIPRTFSLAATSKEKLNLH